jgi:Protein of unknown function (DUF3501)
MRPLTLDDLTPLDEYVPRRGEFFEVHQRYLDRYRRVRVGPKLTLIFENRQTLLFRVQEVLRVARLSEPERVEQELAVYNRLLPGADRLQAALLIDISDESKLTEELAGWRSLRGDQLRLCIGPRHFPADLVTCRPEDRCIGAAHWVQFHISAEGRKDLGAFRLPAFVEMLHPSYRHESAFLSEEIRQSLLDDLAMSDRD